MPVPLPPLLASLLPILLYLAGLRYLDSYRLVRPRSVLFAIGAGIAAAVLAFITNSFLMNHIEIDFQFYSRYGAPLVEEAAKGLYVVYIVRSKKVGFMVDAAICGFAVGSGFSLAENIFYLGSIEEGNLLLWLIRGLGTAVMHGGTTAIFAVAGKTLSDSRPSAGIFAFAPGFLLVAIIHSLFNHFFLPPLYSTISILITVPAILMLVFRQSEQNTRHWLGIGFDSDVELLGMINSGNIAETRVGEYLRSLEDKFQPEVLVDLFCYLRVYLELAIQAKGILLMRDSGFDVPPDPAVNEHFSELKYLSRTIGKTGLLALAPFIHTSSRDLWQLHTLR